GQPSRVIAAGLEIVRTSGFLHDVSVSLSEFAIGFALAIGIGVPLGLLLGRFPVLRYLLDPPIMAIYATPHLALLPIIVVWLGIGMQSTIAVAFVGVVNEVMRYGSEFRTDQRLFNVLLVSLFGVAATSAVRALEEKLWTAGK